MRVALSLSVLIASLVFATGAQAATAVGLGTGDSYAVLGGSGVTNTGPSVINGDLGSAPTPAIVGFGGAPNGTVNGSTHSADAAAASAQADLTTAYDNAAGQGPANTLATELGGQTLTPGVYNSASGTFGITGALTLNAQGNPNAVFIFQTATTLVTASASQVNLINGAQPCNLFWKVGSSATLGSGSAFAGNIFALASISLNDAVTVQGRLLARSGAVTLINDTVTRPACSTSATGGGGETGETGTKGKSKSKPGSGGKGGSGGNGAKGGGGNNGGPTIQVNGVPVPSANRSGSSVGGPNGPGRAARCVDSGFTATFRIHSPVGMRRVQVFLDGKLLKRTTAKRFSVSVDVTGLRTGRSTLRVLAVDSNGRRDVASRSFRRCAAALPSPSFTG